MAIVTLFDRITGLSTDVKPTVNVPNARIFEETDTGKWFRWNIPTTSWILMGQDTRGTPHSNPAAGSNTYLNDPNSIYSNPYMVFSSTTPIPNNPNIPIGAKAIESDTGIWFRYAGNNIWLPTAAGSAAAGSVSDKGGGSATFSGDASTLVFNIPHGLGVAPTVYGMSPGSVAAWASHTVTADATNVIVTYAVAPANAANNLIIRWWAKP